MPFLDKDGLAHFWNHIVTRLDTKIEKSELNELEDTLRSEIDDAIASVDKELYEYPDEDSRAMFIQAMREKADKLGLDIEINGAAGYPDNNLSTGKSMVKLYTIANGYHELTKIWNTPHKMIYTKDVASAIDLYSTVLYDDSSHFASELTGEYFIFGGKTGTTGSGHRLLGVIAEAPNGRQFAAWLSTKVMTEVERSNRHQCMKYLLDIAWALMEDPTADISVTEARMTGMGVVSAAVMLLPQTPNLMNYECFNFFQPSSEPSNLTIDDVAWGGKTYREIFLNGNMFSAVSAITEADNSGWSQYSTLAKPTPTTDHCNTSPMSWNCSGSASVQMSKDLSLSNESTFYIACKRKLTSYTSGGWLGVEVYYIGGAGKVISDTISASNVSDTFETVSHTFTPTTATTQIWMGSGGSANLTGYIDDVVCVNMTELFGDNVPTKDQMNGLYENFLGIYNGEAIDGPVNKYKYEYPIYEYNADTTVNIASNTKVLTAITALDYICDFDEYLTIKASDIQPGSGPVFQGGERMTMRDAFYALMLPSSNTCAYAIARVIGNKLLNMYNQGEKCYASAVIDIAEAEVGYIEKASNSQLDDKTANAGSANYTKYGRDLDAISGFYNTAKNGAQWGDVFNDWCFVKAFGAESAKRLLCQPSNSFGAGVDYSAGYYSNNGQFYTSNPKVGDQIFFKDTAGVYTRTGIVYKVDSTKVYTIEGNIPDPTGAIAYNGVYKKEYSLTDTSIAGYGRPDYDV